MTSLLDSIFASPTSSASNQKSTAATTKGSAKTSTVSLFDTKLDLPTTVHSYPVLRNKRKKPNAVVAPSKEEQSESDTAASPRKVRKTETGKDGSLESTATEEDAADSVPTEEARTVFVGNLPLGYTRRDLQKLFADCGCSIASTRIRSVPVAATGVKLPTHLAGQQHVVKKVCSNRNQIDTQGKQCVSGYVVFTDVSGVTAALLKNHTAVATKTADAVRHIRVDRVGPTNVNDASRSIFVGNLPYTADEETLAAHVTQVLRDAHIGTTTTDAEALIENVRIVRDKETHLCKGFGYILFVHSSSVAHALQLSRPVTYMRNELRLQVCGKRTKNQQGQTTTPKATARRLAALPDSTGALQRVLTKQLSVKAKKKRGTKPATKNAVHPAKGVTPGRSKRAVSQGKTEQRVKKIEKRIAKGMGKNARR